MTKKLTVFRLSDELETIFGSELYALKGGGDSDDIIDGGMLPEVDVYPPGQGDDDNWPPDPDFDDPDYPDDSEDDNSDAGHSDAGGPTGPSSGSGGSGGWDSPTGGDTDTDDNPQGNSSDPWKRDANNNILTTDVEGKTYSQTFGDYEISFQEVKLDGTDVIGYRVTKVLENGVELSEIPDRFKSNCHGFTFAEGDLWFNDPFASSPNFDETSGLMNLIKSETFVNEVSDIADADIAIIWTDNGDGFMWHSAQVNSDGTFTQKSDHGSIFTSSSESDFFNTAIKDNDPDGFKIIYYKYK